MNQPLVLDASVAIAWFFEDNERHRSYALAVLDYVVTERPWLVVPPLFHVELADFLSRRRRHKPARFSAADLEEVLRIMAVMRFETRHVQYGYTEILRWADEYHLQAKDVPYFMLGKLRGFPIAAIDGGIRQACKAFDVKLLTFA
mgnify:CR=1 FL=1